MYTVTVLEYKELDHYEIIIDSDNETLDSATLYANTKDEAEWIAYGASEVLVMIYGEDLVETNL